MSRLVMVTLPRDSGDASAAENWRDLIHPHLPSSKSSTQPLASHPGDLSER